jgi:hypothetical protein
MPLRARLVLVAFGVALATTPASAQRPDFTGTWTRVDSASGRTTATAGDAAFRTGDMGSGWGTPLTITQASDKLSVVYDFFIAYDLQPKTRYSYSLDGTPTTNMVVVGHAPVAVKSTAAWKGDTLQIASTFPVPPGVPARANDADLVQSLHLDATGRLVIVAQRVGAGKRPATVITTYAKR